MKVLVEITSKDDNIGTELRRLVEDFCYGLQEDILPDAEYTIEVKEDTDVTV